MFFLISVSHSIIIALFVSVFIFFNFSCSENTGKRYPRNAYLLLGEKGTEIDPASKVIPILPIVSRAKNHVVDLDSEAPRTRQEVGSILQALATRIPLADTSANLGLHGILGDDQAKMTLAIASAEDKVFSEGFGRSDWSKDSFSSTITQELSNLHENEQQEVEVVSTWKQPIIAGALLPEKGADIDPTNKEIPILIEGRTPLMIAVDAANLEDVELLLSKGADIDLQDSEGWTALMIAAEQKHQAIVELLLLRGADIDIDLQDKAGWTALMMAAVQDDRAILELLLSRGADIDLEDGEGHTAMLLAVAHKHRIILEMLLSKVSAAIDADNSRKFTPLMMAIDQRRDLAIIELLLEEPANIDLQDSEGCTALMIAAAQYDQAIVELLLSKGANINLQNRVGYTALMIAAEHKHHAIVELLLAKGANIDLQGKGGCTVLMIAVAHKHHTMVELLLAKGAKIDADNGRGVTPLVLAIGQGDTEVAKLLLENSDNVVRGKDEAVILLWIAQKGKHQAMINLLKEYFPILSCEHLGFEVL